MSGDRASGRPAGGAETLLDRRDQFLDQRLAARPVVGRVGEDVMAVPAVRIEHDVNDLDAVEVVGVALQSFRRHAVVPGESRDLVDDRDISSQAERR